LTASLHHRSQDTLPPVPGTALVTGASSGIGDQFARQLAARGHDLVLVARRADRLERLASELPVEARVVPCDLATEAASLQGRVAELGVEIEVLVNNAGFGTLGRFWETPEGRDAEMVRLNCEAIITLTRAFLPGMLESRSGGVINVASTAGMQPIPNEATYSATKAFVIYFTDALHTELRGTGVRCLAVNPGPVPTEWQQVAGFADIGRIPGTVSAEQVVSEALATYDRDGRTVIPGALMRWAMRAKSVGPRPLQLRITEKLFSSRRLRA
jgi:uncharacterized protein